MEQTLLCPITIICVAKLTPVRRRKSFGMILLNHFIVLFEVAGNPGDSGVKRLYTVYLSANQVFFMFMKSLPLGKIFGKLSFSR